MSGKRDRFRPIIVSWSKSDSESGEELADVKGLRENGNQRPKSKAKIKGQKTKEIKTNIPSKHPVVQTLPPTSTQDVGVDHDTKKASLRDLCPEDKQRVANLIKELAKVGEEKEKAMQQLLSERVDFEGHIKELCDQQEDILREREGVQQQLQECQSLLIRYQKKAAELNVPKEYITKPDSGAESKAELYSIHSSPQSQTSRNPKIVKGLPTPDPKIMKQGQRSASERPFTDMIDKMIEEDHYHCPQEIEQQLNESFGDPKCDKYFGIGPLSPPKLSSTQKSDASERGPIHLNGEFRPLPSDENCSSIPLASPKRIDVMNEAHISITPEKRQQEIAMQRQALVEEQQRLKATLAEQEKLLQQKQQQLHQQQELHQQRLKCFGQTGAFPTPPQGHYLYPANPFMVPYTHHYDLPAFFTQPPVSQLPRDVIKETKSAATSPMRASVSKNKAEIATSPLRQPAATRDAAIQLTPQVTHQMAKPLPERKSMHEDFSTGQLLELVNEIENQSNAINRVPSKPGPPRVSKGKKPSKSSVPLKSTLKKKPQNFKKMPEQDVSDELEESQVLEDIFFL